VEIRAASREDVGALIGRPAPAGASQAMVQRVRDEVELPGSDGGREAWVADGDDALAVLTGDGELLLVAGDPDVADALLDRAASRGRERGLAAIRVRTAGDDDPVADLADRRGLAVEREVLVMWRALGGAEAEPAWPDGVAVRSFERDDAGPVQALLDEAYSAWDRGYEPDPHDEWVARMTGDADYDPCVWWLAESGGELAGCALHWRSGWVKDIAVRESLRGRGIAEALLRQGFAEFARRGVDRVGLKVDPANPTGAIRLYERLGFVVERRETIHALLL
jgi:GNAT superfamily N-acetyltransferase